MRKLSLASVIAGSVFIASCGHSADDAARKKAQADSLATAKKDSGKHGKLVIALVRDTNQHNFVDANGKRQGHWIITNVVRQLPGYDSNAKVEEGEFQDNLREGEWIEYNADGSIKSRTVFKDDKPIN